MTQAEFLKKIEDVKSHLDSLNDLNGISFITDLIYQLEDYQNAQKNIADLMDGFEKNQSDGEKRKLKDLSLEEMKEIRQLLPGIWIETIKDENADIQARVHASDLLYHWFFKSV